MRTKEEMKQIKKIYRKYYIIKKFLDIKDYIIKKIFDFLS